MNYGIRAFWVFIVFQSISLYGMNLLSPYDTLIRSAYDNLGYRFNVTGMQEFGFSPLSFGAHGSVNNPLAIWQCDVNGLAMLKGFGSNSQMTQLYTVINAHDNGTRGHLVFDGHLKHSYMAGFTARWFFSDAWFLEADLPLYHMQLSDVTIGDKTVAKTAADLRVKNLLTNQFAALVKQLAGINLSGWKRSGCGDFTLLLNWFKDFPQSKQLLKNVRVNWRLGGSIPTAKKIDEDALFAFGFGTDGAFGVPFGVGLDMSLVGHAKFGLDVQLIPLFGNIRDRRIKTDIDQSDLVLLQKAPAYKDFGLTQRLNLYVAFDKVWDSMSLVCGYQYWKHGQDHLTLCTNDFSNAIANTAHTLQEKTWHLLIVNAVYDGRKHFCEHGNVRPYVSLFSRIPFNGKNVVLNHTVGMVLGIDF